MEEERRKMVLECLDFVRNGSHNGIYTSRQLTNRFDEVTSRFVNTFLIYYGVVSRRSMKVFNIEDEKKFDELLDNFDENFSRMYKSRNVDGRNASTKFIMRQVAEKKQHGNNKVMI